eukprot:7376920-Prymnesium_polylepis.1
MGRTRNATVAPLSSASGVSVASSARWADARCAGVHSRLCHSTSRGLGAGQTTAEEPAGSSSPARAAARTAALASDDSSVMNA